MHDYPIGIHVRLHHSSTFDHMSERSVQCACTRSGLKTETTVFYSFKYQCCVKCRGIYSAVYHVWFMFASMVLFILCDPCGFDTQQV